MRQTLIDLIKETIIYEYDLPNAKVGTLKTIYSTHNDQCYSAKDINNIAKIIYNSIVDYAYNEFDIAGKNLDALHVGALKTKLKYNPSADATTKIKYGFFGEVLLYSILITLYHAKPLIARGYFYNPLEKAETKGYDSYQLVDNNGSIELWFGEVKFHANHTQGIDSVMDNIEKALSDTYLETNVLALSNHRNNLNIAGSVIETILDNWEANPTISIPAEIKKYNMTLIYPILILYQHDGGDYNANIKKIPDYITLKHPSKTFTLSVSHKVFFILLPLDKVKEIKQNVIQWIESKKPLIL
ncbi:HamA C-terminal domain-containing protein [Mucilaginibacter pedocola]|uniref:Anti-bacteriophage protein A/HamA C-terminal domain-containing protein n=1 Tax=Mucilaginibacter pedocola TaxID=1792845 RepID=A0A1S9PHE9_9SPHI|nr:DUF1837 domain-containing protein [Mucilaginibacter pedocola]OOQ60380.1 hypothetical protein BC343_25505 [Mucilaginibacter pedocola]